MDTVEEILAHHGIKGMKWGVRKKHGSPAAPASSKTKGHISEDAANAKEFRIKAKVGGTQVLSNKELQHLVNRMNLEQQYSKLSSHSSTLKTGARAGKKVLTAGKTLADVYNTVNSPAYKALSTALKKHAK